MTEERLKEIYDYNNTEYCVGEYDINNEIIDELYNEVVRLRKILNCKEELCKYLPKDTEFVVLTKEDYERNNLTLEELTGVENA